MRFRDVTVEGVAVEIGLYDGDGGVAAFVNTADLDDCEPVENCADEESAIAILTERLTARLRAE